MEGVRGEEKMEGDQSACPTRAKAARLSFSLSAPLTLLMHVDQINVLITLGV